MDRAFRLLRRVINLAIGFLLLMAALAFAASRTLYSKVSVTAPGSSTMLKGHHSQMRGIYSLCLIAAAILICAAAGLIHRDHRKLAP